MTKQQPRIKHSMNDNLSPKMRQYLAEIYQLADQEHAHDAHVGTALLADVLGVTAPAVNRMVNRLKELNLLEHEPYQGVRLTEAGRAEALEQLRVQRITEAFLTQVMGFSWEEVYEDAQAISSAADPKLVQRMEELAGNPRYNPHGEPIPQANRQVEVLDDLKLSEATAGTTVEITRIRTREPDRLQYLAALGLVPGLRFDLIHIAPFNGPMQLKIEDEYRIIGHSLAELIYVRVLEN